MKHATANQTTYRADYRSPPFLVNTVALRFEIEEHATRVTATSELRRRATGPLVLYGADLETESIKINQQLLTEDDWSIADETLTIDQVPDTFSLETICWIHPNRNTALEGLYRSGNFLLTQCEAEGFRKITWFPDRPDVMARYAVTIVADVGRYPVLLSNGNLVDQGALPDGRHYAVWDDPFPKPSYLFALVAGDLQCVEDEHKTADGRNVALRIYVERENLDKVEHAMSSLKKSMVWDEQRFGLNYDLNVYNIVATNDFNMGAMENKSLNIFNSRYVLAKPETATDADYQAIEAVIGHEYFHNWTGNRVTCRDWFQLSLKEGLTVFRDQEFSSDLQSRAVKRIEDVRMLRSHQFAEDAGPMAHPVRPDSFVEINNFYTLTIYEKGAEVVRMYHTLLGEEGFQRGMRLYFDRHDGQAVTCDDFRAAMADANGVDLDQFERWYSQAGTPVVDVQQDYDAKHQSYRLTLRQTIPDTPGQADKQPQHIPVRLGLLNSAGDDLALNCNGETLLGSGDVLELRQVEQSFVFSGVAEAPVPSLFREFSAPVKVNVDYSHQELAFLMAHDNDSFNRWDASQRLAVEILLALVAEPANPIPELYLRATDALLRDRESDPSLLAEALRLPDEGYLASIMSDRGQVVDVDGIHDARRALQLAIGQRGDAQLRENWQRLDQSSGVYSLTPRAIAERSFKNSCLTYLVAGGNTVEAERQFKAASNMTDMFAALRALLHANQASGRTLLDQFYQRWHQEPLVVDKWLALQASDPSPGCLDRLTSLLEHSAFSLRNPNKVRSLIGVFAMSNPVHFHAADGDGYAWLVERILEVDPLNPQVASRLARAFDPWRNYDQQRQTHAQEQLSRLQKAGLSSDTGEVVDRALAQ